jgi:hypothetical protein
VLADDPYARGCAGAASENSSTILVLNSARSFGRRLVTRPRSLTTDSATQLAPAFITSVRIDGGREEVTPERAASVFIRSVSGFIAPPGNTNASKFSAFMFGTVPCRQRGHQFCFLEPVGRQNCDSTVGECVRVRVGIGNSPVTSPEKICARILPVVMSFVAIRNRVTPSGCSSDSHIACRRVSQ